jgi:hypothetical protein
MRFVLVYAFNSVPMWRAVRISLLETDLTMQGLVEGFEASTIFHRAFRRIFKITNQYCLSTLKAENMPFL